MMNVNPASTFSFNLSSDVLVVFQVIGVTREVVMQIRQLLHHITMEVKMARYCFINLQKFYVLEFIRAVSTHMEKKTCSRLQLFFDYGNT